MQAAAHAIGQQVKVLNVSTGNDIDTAFATLVRERPDALYVGPDPLFFDQRDRLVALTERHAMPAIYGDREITEAGGLISYGASRKDAYRQAGIYTGRILKGEKAGDLPVELASKFDLIINLATAKAKGSRDSADAARPRRRGDRMRRRGTNRINPTLTISSDDQGGAALLFSREVARWH